MALADRRSFPETLFFVARGMVGDTWSTESVVVVVTLPASVLPLPVKDPVPLIGYPGEGEKTCEAKSSKVMTSLWF